MRKTQLFVLVFAFLALEWLATTGSLAQSPKVLQRSRLGNETEDLTLVSNGPWAGYVAMMDGYQVRGLVPRQRNTVNLVRNLFDVYPLGIQVSPRGLAYMSSEELFVVDDGIQVNTLFVADSQGHPQGTRTIQYPNGFVPDFLEGLAYIPPNSPIFPDHLIVPAILFSGEVRLEVMQHSGQVVNEIFLDPLNFTYITGVAYHAPDRILVSAAGNQIWDLDFSGNIVAGPVTLDGVSDIEGLAQLSNGNIVATDYDSGTLFFFDQNLNRLPKKDRTYKVGIGVSVTTGVTWNPDSGRYLIAHAGGLPQTPEIVSVPVKLDRARQVVDLAGYGFSGAQNLAYLVDQHLIAMTDRPSRSIVFFDNNGVETGQINVSGFGRPDAVDYIPTTQQLVVKFRESPLLLYVLDLNGNLVRTIDLSSTQLGAIACMAFFNPSDPSGGEFLVLGSVSTNLAVVTDFSGNVLDEFNYRAAMRVISPADVAAITSGPLAGAFSLLDVGNSEIVIFALQ